MNTPTTPDPHILGSIEAVSAFVQAGKATFTLRNTETGNRVTYKVVQETPKKATDAPESPTYEVHVLTGPDNTASGSYSLLGYIRNGKYYYQGQLQAALALKENSGADAWVLGFAGSVLRTVQGGRTLTYRQKEALKKNCKRRDIPLSTIPYEDHRQLGFAWLWRQITETKDLPEKAQVWHEGRCGACNRKLTVPDSISAGLGPKCASNLSL